MHKNNTEEKYRKFLKTRCFEGPFGPRSQGISPKWTALEALISLRAYLPEAPPRRQSLIRPWYVVGSSCSRKSHWKGADSPQHLCTSRCKSNCSCLANFGDWWGSARLWMDCLLSCNQTITCILVLLLHDDQGMSTDMIGCYQKIGLQQISVYLIAVWVNQCWCGCGS